MDAGDYGLGALCPTVQGAFELLSKKWVGLIVRNLAGGELCFSELSRSLPGISARVLSLRMKELEEAGLVLRSVGQLSPVRVSYALTDKGRALEPIVRGIESWARAWGESG